MKHLSHSLLSLREEAKQTRLFRHISRSTVARLHCVKCNASPDEPCKRYNGKDRVGNHIERVMAAAGWI
jgi:hypothetical protein